MLPRAKPPTCDLVLRHARLSHPSNAVFNTVTKEIGIPKFDEKHFSTCSACSFSKTTMQKSKLFKSVYTSPHDNYSDCKYFMGIRDVYSRYYTTIYLDDKGEAAMNLINCVTQIENFFAPRRKYHVRDIRT